MIIDPAQMRPYDAYQLLISSVVPRPVAWVSTVAADGTFNLAPFSFFTAVTNDPPTLLIVNNRRRGNQKKDTVSNIEATGEFVINLATEENSERMNATSGEYGPEVDEFVQAGLTPTPAQLVKAPLVLESPVNIECRLNQIVRLGREDAQSDLIIAQALLWHVRDDLLTPTNTIDVTKLHAIGRLSYNHYTRTDDLFEMIRPQVK